VHKYAVRFQDAPRIQTGTDAPPVEFGEQGPHGAQLQIEGENDPDRLGFLGDDFELLIDAAIAEGNGSADALDNCFDPAEAQAVALAKAKFGDKPCDLEALYPPLKAAQEKIDVLSTVQCDAGNAVLDAKPRTLAGLAAQLIFAAEIWAYDDLSGFLVPLLVNAAQVTKIRAPECRG
jgi:hypothetical protein